MSGVAFNAFEYAEYEIVFGVLGDCKLVLSQEWRFLLFVKESEVSAESGLGPDESVPQGVQRHQRRSYGCRSRELTTTGCNMIELEVVNAEMWRVNRTIRGELAARKKTRRHRQYTRRASTIQGAFEFQISNFIAVRTRSL